MPYHAIILGGRQLVGMAVEVQTMIMYRLRVSCSRSCLNQIGQFLYHVLFTITEEQRQRRKPWDFPQILKVCCQQLLGCSILRGRVV